MNGWRFKANYRVQIIEPDTVLLLSERGHIALKGILYRKIAPLLNGERTTDDLVAALKSEAPPAEIEYTLNRMKAYLTDVDETLPSQEAAFWHTQDADTQRLREATVAVRNWSSLDSSPFAALLTDLGLKVVEDTPENTTHDLEVVLVDDYLHRDLEAFNAEMRRTDQAWLPVKAAGALTWLGPLFEGSEGACWACLSYRLRQNRLVEDFVAREFGEASPPTVALPSTITTMLGFAATEVANILTQPQRRVLCNTLITFDNTSLSLTRHHVVQRPQCPVCGSSYLQEPQPLVLNRRAQGVEPEQMLARYRHHISAITGAVQELQRVYSSDLIHLYDAGTGKAAGFETWEAWTAYLQSRIIGKGRTELRAQVDGLYQALERYSGLYEQDQLTVTAAYNEIVYDDVIHPHELLLYSERQYLQRESLNRRSPPELLVPQPFNPREPIQWTPVWSLTHDRFRLLPTAYCYYDFPLSPDHRFCVTDSNGCAAGSTLEGAIVEGFCELVKADSAAIWWENRLRRPAVDLDSFDEDYLLQMRRAYAEYGRDLWCLDITTDLAVTTFVTLSRRIGIDDESDDDIMMGFGAGLNARTALMNALIEMNAALPNVLDEGRGSPSRSGWRKVKAADYPYLLPDETQPIKNFSTYLDYGDLSLYDQVRVCVDTARHNDLELLVLDQTRLDVDLPVVRVMVPGLRPSQARYAPGRLYEVPVKMEWLSAPLHEAELNPQPLVGFTASG